MTTLTMQNGHKGERSADGGGRSLKISPNLNLLAQHDEMVRKLNEQPSSPGSSSTSPMLGGIGTPLGGLPPPPRGPRRVRGTRSNSNTSNNTVNSLTTVEKDGERIRFSLETLDRENPYINPAPTMEEVSGTRSEQITPSGSVKTSTTQTTGVGDGMAAMATTGATTTRQAATPSPLSFTSSTRLSLSRVERLLFVGKSQQSQQSQPQTTHDSGGKRTSKLVKRTATTPDNATELRAALTSHNSSANSIQSDPAIPTTTMQSDSLPASPDSVARYSPAKYNNVSFQKPSVSVGRSLHSLDFDLQRRSSTSHDSFIDLYSPEEVYSRHSLASMDPSRSGALSQPTSPRPSSDSVKPPIPSSPKPDFSHRRSAQRMERSSSAPRELSLPPTTNLRVSTKRTELVSRSRRLAKIFGETPNPEQVIPKDSVNARQHSLDLDPRGSATSEQASTARGSGQFDVTQYVTIAGSRRHSSPLTPESAAFLAQSATSRPVQRDHSGEQEHIHGQDVSPSENPFTHGLSSPPTSFINLSDDEADDAPSPSPITPQQSRRRGSATALPLSALENLSPENRAEEERRIKRDRLAKLHRFLGSRVPANLVLGLDDSTASLPSPAGSPSFDTISMSSEESAKRVWLRRKRSSSLAAIPKNWQEGIDRLKTDLDDKEKAINVRRAQKMEKMFGVAPPQTLFHTRHVPSSSLQISHESLTTKPKVGQDHPSSPNTNTPGNTTAATVPPKKSRSSAKKARPGTSESSEGLLKDFSPNRPRRSSLAYSHYQHSLNSLSDIIDRDDVVSLASLREYLDSPGDSSVPLPELPPPVPTETFVTGVGNSRDRRPSVLSITSERRRSLPPGVSYGPDTSLTPPPQVDSFQMRRRKATKLTQFFGVDYRELIRDVLDSLEVGLDHDQNRGSLNAEEAEELRQKLRNLKAR